MLQTDLYPYCRVSTASKEYVVSPRQGQNEAFDTSPHKSTTSTAFKGSSLISPAKSQSKPLDFSPQNMAALNAWYVSVSFKAADLDRVLDEKKREHYELDEKIKGLEAARYTLENDKKRILLQIKNAWSHPSPSSSPSKAGNPLKRSQDIRSFSSSLLGLGAFPSTSSTLTGVRNQQVKKENDQEGSQQNKMKKPNEEAFGNDDDDELENEMLKIAKEQESVQKKPKFDGKQGKDM